MNEEAISWLLEDDNPAVKYRTQTEILGETVDKAPVISWLQRFLPADWMQREGLWAAYYLSSFAECGLTFEDAGVEKASPEKWSGMSSFDEGCGDFMRLRALVRLGLGNEPAVSSVIRSLPERQLPDGGFLCLHRLNRLKYTPKSCVKDNLLTLLFCAECKKRGIQTEITEPLLHYFWNHHIFYRSDDLGSMILNTRQGWRTIDTFYPFEVMRVGLQNVVEAFCALGYGNDPQLNEAWNLLRSKRDERGKYVLGGTLSKSYLPKERVGQPSKWVTFYAVLADHEKASVSGTLCE